MSRFVLFVLLMLALLVQCASAAEPPPWPLTLDFNELCLQPNGKGKVLVVLAPDAEHPEHYLALLGHIKWSPNGMIVKLPKKEAIKKETKLKVQGKSKGDLLLKSPSGIAIGPYPYYGLGTAVKIPPEDLALGGAGTWQAHLTFKKPHHPVKFYEQCFTCGGSEGPSTKLRITHPYLEFGCQSRLVISDKITYFGAETDGGVPLSGVQFTFERIGSGESENVITDSDHPVAAWDPMGRLGQWKVSIPDADPLTFEVVSYAPLKNLSVFIWPPNPIPPQKLQFVVGDDYGWKAQHGPLIILDDYLQKVIAVEWMGQPVWVQVAEHGYVFACLDGIGATPITKF